MNGRVLTFDAVDLVLRQAKGRVGACESPPNSNRGPYVERVLKSVKLPPGNPWCAADLYDIGTTAIGGLWPLPQTGGCVVLGEFAAKHQILFDKPERGDAFLLWERVNGVWRYAHTGFIDTVKADGWCDTTEGNTNGGGSREGWLHAEKTRRFGSLDRFIRWVNLL